MSRRKHGLVTVAYSRLTIWSRISSDIINCVRANELFPLSAILRVQGEKRIPFFGDFMSKWNIKPSMDSLPTIPTSTKIFLVLNEAKNWAEGNSYLVSNSIQNWGQYFSSRFLLFGREKEWPASASSCGHTDPSSLCWAARASAVRSAELTSPPTDKEKRVPRWYLPGCHFDPQLIWQHQLGFSCSNYVTY